MIFLDTSGLYALADRDDENHEEAVRVLESAQRAKRGLLTHSYVLVESAALIHRRLGREVALVFLEEAQGFTLLWVDEDLHNAAVTNLRKRRSARLSLVDVVSFLVMLDRDVKEFLGFDKHFTDDGFTRYRP
ncbi:MAG: PIN domain-containing protein [Armatimonadetes bacterium]|nr:PIN domain-containing protein [Armatimonadota bacterium]